MEDKIQDKRKLLRKYYDQTCTKEEELQVIELLSNLENDIVLQTILKEEWEKIPENIVLESDTSIQWENWIKKAKVDTSSNKITLTANSTSQSSKYFVKLLKWAAVLFPLIALYVLYSYESGDYFNKSQQLSQKIEWIVKETTKGQKLTFTLPDGTSVKMNSSSHLSFSKNFLKDDARIVKLNGEAFFEVTKMKGLPFIVESQNMKTTVLGTSFGVKSYSYNKVQHVAVLEGKVKVEQKEPFGNKAIFLVKDQMVSLKSTQGKDHFLDIASFSKESVLGWKDGLLVFKDQPLKDLILLLEEWYGVEFIVTDDIPINKKFTGTFKNKPLSKVLDGIGFSSRFSYTIKGNKVYVKPKS
ncbi:FecR family protein [Chondrinema litorale]|uniref:FecR family protein n=1 Tax=Chondrinema litorale TaxID=2994555 RepID=UPI002542C2CF|nr:FecR family protein [Chondrinema litorale]UZR98968.1 DUF4974 domain-containing protein [Chondrinema litorale]